MADLTLYIIPVLMVIVAAILVLGLLNMLKGNNANRSQRLMRYRIAFQFLAVIAMVAAVYFIQRG